MGTTGQFYAIVFCYVSTLRGTVGCNPGDRIPDDASPRDLDRLLKAAAIRLQEPDDDTSMGLEENLDPVVEAPTAVVEGHNQADALRQMKVTELKAYAAGHDIDLGNATRKADIIAVLTAGQK